MRDELLYELKTLSNIVGNFILLVASVFKTAINLGSSIAPTVSSSTPTTVNTITLLQNPDPILLVKIDNYWIEIGRWE